MILFVPHIKAQDIHFSQFYANAMTVNPAETGNFNSDFRISNIYRNQWKSIVGIPYKTLTIGFDKNFYINDNNFAWGVYIIHDQSGPAALTANKIYGSFAWHKTINSHKIHVGIQPGFSFKSINSSELTFPSQYDRDMGDFNTGWYNNEANLNESLNYFDLNVGGIWSKPFGKIIPEIGFALFHINYPKETFYADGDKIALRKVFHASTRYNLNESFYITPRFLYMGQRKASDMILGGNFGYNVAKNQMKLKSVFFGPYFRSGFARNIDAAYFVIGGEFKTFDVGFSYDFNVSGLQTATNGRGAFEISFVYKAATSILNQIDIPCDRF